MKSLLLLLLAIIFVHAEILKKNEVLLVNSENHDETIKKQYPIMLLFCQEDKCHENYIKQYEQAANQLRSHNIYLGLINDDEDLNSKYNAKSFPSFKLLANGQQTPYPKPFKVDEFVAWCRLLAKPAINYVKMKRQLESFRQQFDSIIAYFDDDEKADDNLKSLIFILGQKRDQYLFVLGQNQKLRDQLQLAPNQRMVFYHQRKVFYFPDQVLTPKSFEIFISQSLQQKIHKLTPQIIDFFEQQRVPLIILSYSSRSAFFLDKFEKFYDEYKHILAFGTIDTDSSESLMAMNKLSSFFSFKDQMGLFILDFRKTPMRKYKDDPSKSPSFETGMYDFIDNWFENKLEPYLKSEERPKENDKTVKVIVGSAVDEMVYDHDEDVFLMIHAEWCGHCKSFMPVFEKVAEHFKDNKHLIFGTVNGPENEVKGVSANSYPTVVFVQKGDVKPKVIYYNQERNEESVIEFIKNSVRQGGEVPIYDSHPIA